MNQETKIYSRWGGGLSVEMEKSDSTYQATYGTIILHEFQHTAIAYY